MNSLPAPNLADDPYLALLDPPSITRPVGYRMRFALHAAVLAPSVHNTQPWRFRFSEGEGEGADPYTDLLMDADRELPELDPGHRQLVISCGAALEAYQIGLLGCGLLPRVETFPNDAGPPCAARIRASDAGVADPVARELLTLLRRRRSYRGPMTSKTVGHGLRKQLAQAAEPRVSLDFVPEGRYRRIEDIITESSLELAEYTNVNQELRTWTRLSERTHDGVPAANWQRTSEQTAMAPVVQRDFAQGRPLPGGAPVPTVEDEPLLAVFLSRGDTAADWLQTGSALLRVALAAERAGLAMGYLNQPTEVPGLREKLASVITPPTPDFSVPQLVVRIGYPAAPPPPATPRRTVGEVLRP